MGHRPDHQRQRRLHQRLANMGVERQDVVAIAMADGHAQAAAGLPRSTCTSRPGSATPWVCSTTPRRPARRCCSRRDSTTSRSPRPSRSYVGVDLDRPLIDYVGLAKSLGVPGEHVEKSADVAPAVSRGLKSGGPYLIDVRIDSTFK